MFQAYLGLRDLLLGYLDPDYFLGGRMRLAREPADRAVREHLAAPLAVPVEEAAVAAYEVINAGMAAGIRDMIVDHGLDPEAMPMVVGGGAGPVHAAAVAMELGIREVIVPRQSGVFCAVGMLFADLKHDLVRSCYASGEQLAPERWQALFAAMAGEGRRTLVSEGARLDEVEVRYSADLRYLRQIHELSLPVDEDLAKQTPTFTNASLTSTTAATLTTLLYLLSPEVLHNHGLVRAVDIHAPAGSILNAQYPAATFMGNKLCQHTGEAIMLALREALPERITAPWGRRLSYRMTGKDPRNGRGFHGIFFLTYEGGARPTG